APAGPEGAQRLFGATAALLKKRQTHPEGNGCGGQGHPNGSIAAWREGPVERRAQIIDFRGVIREPFVRRPFRRLSLGALEKIEVILGVAARDLFALTAHVKLLDCIGASCVE